MKTNSTLPCGCDPKWPDEFHFDCVLNKPLMMVIPPNGVHLNCPAHPKGHHIYGNQVRC